MKTYLSYQQIEEYTKNIYESVNKSDVDYIVGLSRGGLLSAVIISNKLNIPMIPLQLSTRDFIHEEIPEYFVEQVRGKNILVIDDICDTGTTINHLSKELKDICNHIYFGVLLNRVNANDCKLDYIGLNIYTSDWIVYPWEE